MARADLILALVQAASDHDDLLFRRTVDAMIADERAKKHNVFADQLLKKAATRQRSNELRQLGPKIEELAFATMPRRTLDSLYLQDEVRAEVSEFISEHQRIELLRSHGLEPRNRILLTGAPGNGKTSLAEAIAEALALPFYIVRYEGIIANLLGDTARRMNTLVERLASERCLIFFDEFDSIAKTRSDENESGEMKRLVTSLLGHLDRLAPHVIVVAATNHPELLDRAIWRRFRLHLSLKAPDDARLLDWVKDLRSSFQDRIGLTDDAFVTALRGKSFSYLEDFRNLVRRRYILGLPDGSLNTIVKESLRMVKRQPAEMSPKHGTAHPFPSDAQGNTSANWEEDTEGAAGTEHL